MRKNKRNESKFDHYYFSAIDSEQKAYWLGFIMADGNVQDRVKRGAMQLSLHLAGRDAYQLELFREAINSNKNINTCQADGSVRFALSSDRMCSDLISIGCVPRKSLVLQYPSIPESLDRHFIRGYFDGDGHVGTHGTRLFAGVTGTEDFLLLVRKRLGLSQTIIKRSGCCCLQWGTPHDLQRLYSYFYDNATVWLDRKRSKYGAFLVSRLITVDCKWCLRRFLIPQGMGRANRRYCSRMCRNRADYARR